MVGLIGLLAILLRRFGTGGAQFLVKRKGRDKRLGIVETLPIDARRRLVLLRRDDKEHLVLCGATSDLLIEGDISAGGVAHEAAERPTLATIVRGGVGGRE